MGAGATFDVDRAHALVVEVSLRAEPFGALAYHHGNRRLVFLKSTELARLVGSLGSFASVSDALCELAPEGQEAAYERALAALHAQGMIRAL